MQRIRIRRVNNYMALLRNLRNMVEAGVSGAHLRRVAAAVAHEPAVRASRQLPFRFYAAYREIEGIAPPYLLDAVEAAMTTSLGNLPRFGGRVVSLADNSGSARGTTTSRMGRMQVATIANLTAVVTGMVADEGWAGVFGDRLATVPVRPRASVFHQLAALERLGEGIGGGTENGIWLFWDRAIRTREHWDSVFVYSDMQAGHGGLYGEKASRYAEYVWGGTRFGGGRGYIDVPKLIARYRAEVNPRVRVFLVQVAGYGDTIVPEFYQDTYILGGWGPGLLRFAAAMSGTATDPSRPSPLHHGRQRNGEAGA